MYVHVFVDRVSTVSIPHRLDRPTPRTSPDISSEPATGNNLSQAVDIGVEWKRRSDLPNTS